MSITFNEAFDAVEQSKRVWFIHEGQLVSGFVTEVTGGGPHPDRVCVAVEIGEIDPGKLFFNSGEAFKAFQQEREAPDPSP
ncbi:hypothetical protein LAZ40_07195 [Cereibacter sphaeroides]|uniref:hypothetical protein n=1 Tax=Cereibacter sphaeroides TaxID=1063 RepID=UPI001F3132F4|nr:hypothetical protein [Cereibacter sphaeroides]MCE6958833.1 hypothetical protein [Cereibacter sphaeroides]MCE6973293.1 hypothetical protein [Cereibacter sphaeroides]